MTSTENQTEPSTFTERTQLDELSNGQTSAAERRDPHRPALFVHEKPRNVNGRSAHQLVRRSLNSIDGRVFKAVREDRFDMTELVNQDLKDAEEQVREQLGYDYTPGNGRDSLVETYQHLLQALVSGQALLSEAKDSAEEDSVKALRNSMITLTFQARALLAHRNGDELSGPQEANG